MTAKPIMIEHCVWKLVPQYINKWAELYGHYSNGFLLNSGGIGEQPEWYLRAMSKFAGAYNKANEEMRDKLKS